jgi:mRNA-degrading endonuclease RelE of RelBE toxin-antitoxin system
MEIVETSIYTKEITRILSDDEYKELQNHLVLHPKSGKVIKGSGGLRKLRWSSKWKGKSGGIRNIYYFYEDRNYILMIFIAYIK